MRNFVALILLLFPQIGIAQEWEDRQLFTADTSTQMLRVISSTDTVLFAPIIEHFVAENPSIGVEYLVHGTSDIDQIFRTDPDGFDLVVSSAMDLQLKLVNDGLALRLPDLVHPSWAQWRQSLFAFTSEPAAIVINNDAFAGHKIPQTRQQLIEALRERPDAFRGRVGTYDIRKSGVGYLFATQDARATETYWRLMEVLGTLGVRLYCCSGAMIDDLTDGRIAVAYNVLGSYAEARVENRDKFQVILPSDFPTTMMRTAMVSVHAPNPEPAAAFIRHLVALQSADNDEVFQLPRLNIQPNDIERATIALEPALMTFLDALKRRRFVAEWENAVIQE